MFHVLVNAYLRWIHFTIFTDCPGEEVPMPDFQEELEAEVLGNAASIVEDPATVASPTASQRTAAKSAPSRRSKNRSEQGEDLQSQTSPSRGTGEDVRSQLPKSGKGKEARQAARSGTGEETRQVCPVEEDVKEEAANRDDEDMGQAQNALEEGQWDALKR